MPRLRAKGARSDRQGPGDVFLRRQKAVHAHGQLPPKLCGVAHLPRDGAGCEKDAARRSVRGGSLDAAEGEADHQPSRDTPITTRTRASIFAPEGFGPRNLLGTRAILFSHASARRIMSRKKRPNAASSSHRWAATTRARLR